MNFNQNMEQLTDTHDELGTLFLVRGGEYSTFESTQLSTFN